MSRARPRIGTGKAQKIATCLAGYYERNRRRFPWRTEKNAYHHALAEILLQKTRAHSIVKTYQQLVKAYPTPASLGRATLANLERRIRHLGLARKRASYLKRLGLALAQRGVNALSDPTVSIKFPGLGAYGARAVACFAFGLRIGIVDANVRRVLTRVFDLPHWEYRSPKYQEVADTVVAAGQAPTAVNYGLLDLAAVVCTPRPRCDVCPLMKLCIYASKVRSREPLGLSTGERMS